MEKLHVIKIGGNVIDNPVLLAKFVKDFASLSSPKILVHGGGKIATEIAGKLGIEQTMIAGRRITDKDTLQIAVMVYAGLLNKQLVALCQAEGIQALGLSGADGNAVVSTKRQHPTIDFGYVGDVQCINTHFLQSLLVQTIVPIMCAITHDGKGTLLNTNADTIATELAVALSAHYDVHLSFCFEKKGVLTDVQNEEAYLPRLDKQTFQALKTAQTISDGMIPKLENAFDAIAKGVGKVMIYHAQNLPTLENNFIGTIIHE